MADLKTYKIVFPDGKTYIVEDRDAQEKITDIYSKLENIDVGDIDLSDYYTKQEIDNIALFKNNKPTSVSIGGIEKGTILTNQNAIEILNKLLYPYVAPQITSFILKPTNGGVKEIGTSVSLTGADINIEFGSEDITSLIIYDGASKLIEVSSNIKESNSTQFSLSINSNKTLKAEIKDNKNTVSKNSSSFTFVYPIYYGSLSNNSNITETEIKTLTKSVSVKGTKTYSYNLSNQIAVIAYPKSYGSLTLIKDSNGYDLTESFIQSETNIVCLDQQSIPYYVYRLFQPATASTSYTFSF